MVAWVVGAVAVSAHAQGLRLDRHLTAPRDEPGIALPSAPAPPLRLIGASTLGPKGPPAAAAIYEELLLEIDVNKQGLNKSTVVLRRGDGMFLLKAEDLAGFRLRIPSTAPYIHDRAPFFPIDALPGARFELDDRTQRLTIMAGADAFESSVEIVPGTRNPSAVRPTIGAFLNYDILATHGAGATFFSNLMEGGVFTPYGVLVSTMVANRDDDGVHAVRLESTFTSDFPSRHATLRVGDSISRPGAWGTAAHFGGVQYGTNFATEPTFRTFPSQPVRGQAVVPSVVDIYVNNTLVSTRRVDPGPFTMSNIPFTTGGGTVRLVMRDINNQQQVVTVSDPFYSSSAALKKGLSDYSGEIGKVREDFGLENFHYGNAFASGTFRHGFTDHFTAEIHGETTREQRALGGGFVAVHPLMGQLDATWAASQSPDGAGTLAGIGYQRAFPRFSFGGQARWASPNFRRIFELPGVSSLKTQQAYGMGTELGGLGSVSINRVVQKFHDGTQLGITSLGYALPVRSLFQFNLNAIKTTGQQDGLTISAGVTVPLGSNRNASAQWERATLDDETTSRLSTSFQQNRVADSPYSYRVSTRGREVEAIGEYRADRFEAELGIARSEAGEVATRAEVRGGIGYVGGYAFLSRRLTGSFGVVQVADYPDVAVLFDNQFAGRTNDRGFFVIPDLRPYDRNIISVRDVDLPLDATVGALKMDASPYYRSGLMIQFPVRHLRAGVMYIMLDDGKPIPSGALVRLEGQSEEFPVALGGEAYVNGFGAKDLVIVEWNGQKCTLDVAYPDTKDPLPDLGRYVCKGIRP